MLRFHTQTAGLYLDGPAAGQQTSCAVTIQGLVGGAGAETQSPAHQLPRTRPWPLPTEDSVPHCPAQPSRSSPTSRAQGRFHRPSWPALSWWSPLTDQIEKGRALEYIDKIDQLGGAVEAHLARDSSRRRSRIRPYAYQKGYREGRVDHRPVSNKFHRFRNHLQPGLLKVKEEVEISPEEVTGVR